jgi:hypothetical protein
MMRLRNTDHHVRNIAVNQSKSVELLYFFAGDILSVRLKKRKGPVLANFFSTVH